MRGGGGRGGGGGNRGSYDPGDRILEKLGSIQGPTFELEPLEQPERRFNGRCRLYVGNLSPDVTEEKLREVVGQFGEIGELFFNCEKHFAFFRMESRAATEAAKRALDGHMLNGRPMRVRFSQHQGAVRVSNLGPWVSNELLHRAFSVFGDIERCLVSVDDRGRSKGEGFVEFERKNVAQECVRRCKDGCYFLTASLRPVVVEMIEELEDEDGLQVS